MEHYLYTLEIVVRSLTITKPNECAPEEYPIHVELRFRRGLYVSIPETQFGKMVDKTYINDKSEIKCNEKDRKGRCCVFTLERKVDNSDLLDIRVYKKVIDKCKFLIGQADLPMQKYFDKVMAFYLAKNSARFYNSPTLKAIPEDKGTSKSPLTPYPPASGDKPYGSTEAEVEERKTKTAPKDDETQFKSEGRKDEFGIHTDRMPFVPDKAASLSAEEVIQLKNAQGEGTGFVELMFRLSCMGQVVCCNIPYNPKEQ